MSLFPRFVQGEFAQFARLIDDLSTFQSQFQPARSGAFNNSSSGFRSFQPRFDVRESTDSYELSGELPGVTDIDVEFTDASTLTIKGKSHHTREQGTRPTAAIPDSASTPAANAQTESASDVPASDSASASYHKASVEDEGAPTAVNEDGESVTLSEGARTPASEAPETAAPAPAPAKYWVAERSVGEFARTFTFPARIDQDAVRASLKDGILSVTVPKAKAPAARKITVE